jgi:hypothetical protein
MSNKGVRMSGAYKADDVVFNNVEFDGFRGEILYYGGYGNRITIANSHLHDSNADAISMSADVYVTNTTIYQVYNAFENLAEDGTQRTVILNSLLDGAWANGKGQNGVVVMTVPGSGIYVSGSTIQNWGYGAYLSEFVTNATIRNNVFDHNGTDIYWKSLYLYANQSFAPNPYIQYNNTWVDSNVFQSSTQAFYDPNPASAQQRNLVISHNAFTQKSKFFVDSTGGMTPTSRANFEIFGNSFAVQMLWQNVGRPAYLAYWHDNQFNGTEGADGVNSYSTTPVVVQVSPGSPMLILNAFWAAGSTISVSNALANYPPGFQLTLIGPAAHGGSDKMISIVPNPAWNSLTTSYTMGLNAHLVLKKNPSTGRFDFVSYTGGTGW